MVAVPLPPVGAAGTCGGGRRRRLCSPSESRASAFSSWLRKLWPPAERHLPADATIPGKAERRIALQLAAVPAAAALVSLLPVFGLGHANLLTAPPWALAAVFLAVLQLVYAAWMINVPDWASARVQMVVCAIVTTIYGMLMTLTMITPVNHPLILGLGEVRRARAGLVRADARPDGRGHLVLRPDECEMAKTGDVAERGIAFPPYRAKNSILLTSFRSQPARAATAASAFSKRKTSMALSLRLSEKAYMYSTLMPDCSITRSTSASPPG